MGPDNPWSPSWRPDPSGTRLARIRVARRGAVLAGLAYLPVGAAVLVNGPASPEVVIGALLVGLPGIALLGAGLAPATSGSRVDAVVAGLAFGIGAPVAAVTSLLIGGFIIDGFIGESDRFAGPILMTSVRTAVAIAPVLALASAAWTVATRRLAGDRPRDPAVSPPGR
jgi:hypothetical protein